MILVRITVDFLSTNDASRRSPTHMNFSSTNDHPPFPGFLVLKIALIVNKNNFFGLFNNLLRLEIRNVPSKGRGIFSTRSFTKVSSSCKRQKKREVGKF